MGTNGAWEWLMFLIDLEKELEKFYDEQWKTVRKRLVFLFDNASIHKQQCIKDFFEKWKLLAFTIPQYTPMFNPIEWMFAAAKNKLQRNNISNRLLEHVAIRHLKELDEWLLFWRI